MNENKIVDKEKLYNDCRNEEVTEETSEVSTEEASFTSFFAVLNIFSEESEESQPVNRMVDNMQHKQRNNNLFFIYSTYFH